MHMTAEEMINCIPKFECSDGQKILVSETFLKQKLYNALTNPRIINLARGEGRSTALNDIIFHPEILFNWGEKSMHAFPDNQNSKLREFCDPDVVNKEILVEYIEKYAFELGKKMLRYEEIRIEGDVRAQVEPLINSIVNEANEKKLL